MFQMLELLYDINDLREVGLTEEEVVGYLELFFETYKQLAENVEVV